MNNTQSEDTEQSTQYLVISQYVPLSKRKSTLTEQGVGLKEFGDVQALEINESNVSQLDAWFNQFKSQKDGFINHHLIGIHNQQYRSEIKSYNEQDDAMFLILPEKFKNDELCVKLFQELVKWNETHDDLLSQRHVGEILLNKKHVLTQGNLELRRIIGFKLFRKVGKGLIQIIRKVFEEFTIGNNNNKNNKRAYNK
eukprot:196228_1